MTDSIDVEEYREYQKTGQLPLRLLKKPKGQPGNSQVESKKNPARVATPGRMNKTEARYAQQLEAWRLSGEIHSWLFEPLKLRLATRTYYSPDFLVQRPDGSLEFHEVKGGFIREDAMVKLKVAAKSFPSFRFVLCQKVTGKDWTFTTISNE